MKVLSRPHSVTDCWTHVHHRKHLTVSLWHMQVAITPTPGRGPQPSKSCLSGPSTATPQQQNWVCDLASLRDERGGRAQRRWAPGGLTSAAGGGGPVRFHREWQVGHLKLWNCFWKFLCNLFDWLQGTETTGRETEHPVMYHSRFIAVTHSTLIQHDRQESQGTEDRVEWEHRTFCSVFL